MAHEPPVTVTLRWCPECGRWDRYLEDAHAVSFKRCPGTVQTLTYELRPAAS